MKRKIKITDRKTALIIGILLIIGVLGVLSIPEVNASIVRGFYELYYPGNFSLKAFNNLSIVTDNIIRMHIAKNGNIGIGMTNPANTLEINGSLMVYDEIKQGSNQSIINRIVNSGRKEVFTSISDGFSQGAVPINTWMRPVMTNYSVLGHISFAGAVFDGKNIWLVPSSALVLGKINPATGFMVNYSADYNSSAFRGGVFDGQNIWLVPYNSVYLVKVNPATGEMTNYSAEYGTAAFFGGVFDGKNIWLIPAGADYLVKVNPATGEMTNYSQGYGSSGFTGGVFDGQNIWMIPVGADYLVKVNPATGEMTNYSVASYGSNIFGGGVFDGQNIWMIPYSSDYLVKVNPATGAMTNYPAEGYNETAAFMGGVFDGQNIWMIPYSSTDFVKVNPKTGERTNYSQGYGITQFVGGVFDGQNIWMVPFNSNYIVKLHPQEFGNEILYTGGNATIGGSLLVSGTIGVAGRLNINSSYNQTFNCIGNDTAMDDGLNSSKDLFIEDELEVDGVMYLTGGNLSVKNSDVAENLLTETGKKFILCEKESDCAFDYIRELEHGDVVCINPITAQTIEKCTEANSRNAIGVISNTSVINMGNNGKYSYPVAVAGVVWTKATNENGNINLGDWLVSSSKPGYAMKNNEPKPGTVLGKAFTSCNEEECRILVFVAH